ncbi:MAG: hypothetical protein WAN35_03660 [Terracidiphilus sp.]
MSESEPLYHSSNRINMSDTIRFYRSCSKALFAFAIALLHGMPTGSTLSRDYGTGTACNLVGVGEAAAVGAESMQF